MNRFIENELQEIRRDNLWRSLPRVSENHVNFSTNDYLGLSAHPRVVEAASHALKKYGSGGKSSRLVSGTAEIHGELEFALARFKKSESCLVYPSGFMANMGVIGALLGEGDAVIMDRLNHASLLDAAKLSRARIFVYDHASPESLERVLERTRKYPKKLVVTDSLFSMDGDLAPLKEMSDLCRSRGVWLMIDDAHATGVLGAGGIGALEHFGILGKAEIVVGTLSKALGSQGGFVCGPRDLMDYLVNRSRAFIYTTALSPASCGAALEALQVIQDEPGRRESLLRKSEFLRDQIRSRFGSNAKLVGKPVTPIVPFWTGTAESALEISKALGDEGIFVPAIRPPTVKRGECRLRISLSSDHGQQEIHALLESLEGVMQKK